MNFFGGGEPQKPAGPDPLFAATTEMEMYTDLFNKLTASCFSKCASKKHKEPDLSLGEMSCADRCVSKYLEAQQKIGIVLQQANESQAQQQQQMMSMQQTMAGRK
ncbi:membrane translocase subunit TIM10 [Seminavis robusta]|uniref:Mitochondrial import inner membrane translocase subunit n=1 Tax=Seminavis robusta TaxID=568900 RepID=A0A9N8DWW5_9STRA|nr:membrane translocase subunit TIM10 [Seminavis robusta]|eukprot:Sro355_g125010.1 membrane translocase subunit TIM10 (105) ;mRNA; r:21262-21691